MSSQSLNNEKNMPIPKITVERVKAMSYFLNDKNSKHLRIIVVGLILSFLAIQVICDKFSDSRIFDGGTGIFIVFGYIVGVGYVNYELYYGLKTDDPRRYFSWIILKLFELFLLVASMVYGFFDGILVVVMVFSIVVFVFDCLITFTVFKLWRRGLNKMNANRNGILPYGSSTRE